MSAAKSPSLLPFPTAVFPKPLREYIEHGSSQNYPEDFVGAGLLACLATAIGASHALEVNANWHEPTTLFIAIVGDAGVRKSSSLICDESHSDAAKAANSKALALSTAIRRASAAS